MGWGKKETLLKKEYKLVTFCEVHWLLTLCI
jgi:hypothetical protein